MLKTGCCGICKGRRPLKKCFFRALPKKGGSWYISAMNKDHGKDVGGVGSFPHAEICGKMQYYAVICSIMQ